MGKIVFVHGIGHPQPDYWFSWRDKVSNAIGNGKFDPDRDYHGAWWDGIMDEYLEEELWAPAEEQKFEQFKDEIRNTLRTKLLEWSDGKESKYKEFVSEGLSEILLESPDKKSAIIDGIIEKILEYLGDFIFYLWDASLANKVQHQLRLKLAELSGDSEIHIVCHSWGTVVSYDVLNLWTACPAISSLITFGSPLWLPVVNNDRQNYLEKAARWTNVYNKGNFLIINRDPIGGPLKITDSKGRFKDSSIRNSKRHDAGGYLGDDEMAKIMKELLL